MINFLKALYQLFSSVIPESYLEMNSSKSVVYPYLTYSYDSREDERFVDEFTISVDVFDDRGKSFVRIEQVCFDLKKALSYHEVLTDEFLMRIYFVRQNPIPTGSNILQRRNMEFSIKIDWRN